MSPMDFWREMGAPGPDSVVVGGTELRRGSRVLLRPAPRGDVFDLALDGRVGVVEATEEDDTGEIHVVVTLEEDPGRELGEARFIAHRFFFRTDEVVPLDLPGFEPSVDRRVLVAGIGNIFLGDDAFGVEVVNRLAKHELPAGVDVVDFGIRGMDLAYALQEPYDAAVFVDAAPRGEAPGTLSVIEPELTKDEAVVETHAMDPVKVLALARELGRVPGRTLVLACEPANVVHGEPDEELTAELSEPVRAAVDKAVRLAESLVADLLSKGKGAESDG